MRLAGQVKGGYYPIPSYTLAQIARRLVKLEDPALPPPIILDPCCGCGEAIQDLAGAIGVPAGSIYAIELDEGRQEAARGLLGPAAHLLPPCSFDATQISYHSFSLVYLNPPYDDQFGGGKREELVFLNRATQLLQIGGVLVFVAPIKQFVDNKSIAAKLDANYRDCELYTFPDHERKYGEAIFFGIRRTAVALVDEWAGENMQRIGSYRFDRPIDAIDLDTVWELPPGEPPKNFLKVMYTEKELLKEVRKSPMNQLFSTSPPLKLARPAMALGPGHRSLLVICGFMNGTIKRNDEPSFVLRGTVDKETYMKDRKVDADGGSLTKYGQHAINNVRCVGQDGDIITFSNAIKVSPET